MPAYTMTKGGERVRVSSNVERDKYLALGYTVETDSEQDPRDKERAVLADGKLSLGVKASAPAGPNAVGDVYVATGGVLKICTVAGSPGTWVSVGAQT